MILLDCVLDCVIIILYNNSREIDLVPAPQQVGKEAINMGIKAIVGIVLVVVSFIYLIKNPGQSLMDGLMKNQEKMSQKAAEDAENAEKPEVSVDVTSDDETQN